MIRGKPEGTQLPVGVIPQHHRGDVHSQGGVRKGTGMIMAEADQKRAASAYG